MSVLVAGAQVSRLSINSSAMGITGKAAINSGMIQLIATVASDEEALAGFFQHGPQLLAATK